MHIGRNFLEASFVKRQGQSTSPVFQMLRTHFQAFLSGFLFCFHVHTASKASFETFLIYECIHPFAYIVEEAPLVVRMSWVFLNLGLFFHHLNWVSQIHEVVSEYISAEADYRVHI